MEIQMTGRHTKVSESMKSYAVEKFSRLERHNDLATRAEVVLNIENDQRHIAEMIAHTKVGGPVVGKAEHTDMYAAIDLLVEKMDHQLTKHKEKVKVERKHASIRAAGARPETPGAGEAAPGEGGAER